MYVIELAKPVVTSVPPEAVTLIVSHLNISFASTTVNSKPPKLLVTIVVLGYKSVSIKSLPDFSNL